MDVFGNGNQACYPGLDSQGNIIPASRNATGSATVSGAAITARVWILLNGQYITPDVMLCPQDSLVKWGPGQAVTTNNLSFAGLQLADDAASTNSSANLGRHAEWKNNAHSKSILMSDRIYSGTSDATLQSVWTTAAGDWKGHVAWGDLHTEFAQSFRGFETQYARVTNINDNLFATQSSPQWREGGTRPDSNTMMIYY